MTKSQGVTKSNKNHWSIGDCGTMNCLQWTIVALETVERKPAVARHFYAITTNNFDIKRMKKICLNCVFQDAQRPRLVYSCLYSVHIYFSFYRCDILIFRQRFLVVQLQCKINSTYTKKKFHDKIFYRTIPQYPNARLHTTDIAATENFNT